MRCAGKIVWLIGLGSLLAEGQLIEEAARSRRQQPQDETLRRIVEASTGDLALLLSWITVPPPQVDRRQLRIALSDAFGRLKAKQSIPFLIENITIHRWQDANTWLKDPKVIEERMPAVAALIEIGEESCSALVRTPLRGAGQEERVARLFAINRLVARKTGCDGVRGFLSSVLGQANQEVYWATETLRALEASR